MKVLGEVLLEAGLVTEGQLLAALDTQAESGVSLGQALVAAGSLAEDDLVRALAEQAGLRYVDLDDYPVDRGVVGSLGGALCRRHAIVPIGTEGDAVVLAMAEPGNVMASDDARSMLGRRVIPVVASRAAIDRAITRWVRSDEEIDSIGLSIDRSLQSAEAETRVEAVVEDSPVVKWVRLIVTQAIEDGASDIHVEPSERDLRVRYRIDGVLHNKQSAPQSIQNQVISRIKILADIDIAERRKPQDGRISLNLAGKRIDLRVATLPVVWGEKVVLRILNSTSQAIDLRALGFSEHNLELFTSAYTKPYGMILATGPTGSGKSTTLYATLGAISRPEVNVMTIEDPVEYRMDGVNQIQVNPKAGLTFASALRSILRADPDVVLVGEIRDRETAQIAVEAALTGHLVLSTLHTNDAPSALTRLTEMGIEPFLVGSALDLVVAQRLARRLCQRCRTPYEPTAAELAALGEDFRVGKRASVTLFNPGGCPSCAGTGYRGRLAIHEVMPITKEVEHLGNLRSPSADVAQLARDQGMVTLRMDGWEKVKAGQTSIEELLRVVA
jgi:type IV pilus assembly protein PilB